MAWNERRNNTISIGSTSVPLNSAQLTCPQRLEIVGALCPKYTISSVCHTMPCHAIALCHPTHLAMTDERQSERHRWQPVNAEQSRGERGCRKRKAERSRLEKSLPLLFLRAGVVETRQREGERWQTDGDCLAQIPISSSSADFSVALYIPDTTYAADAGGHDGVVFLLLLSHHLPACRNLGGAVQNIRAILDKCLRRFFVNQPASQTLACDYYYTLPYLPWSFPVFSLLARLHSYPACQDPGTYPIPYTSIHI